MAFKLTKAELDRKGEIERTITEAVGKAEDGLRELEEAVKKLVDDFNTEYIDPLNDALKAGYDFADDIANERQSEYDDKSERWQEGDRGQAAYSWLSQVESARDCCEEMQSLDAPTFDYTLAEVDDFENLPEEMEV